MKKSARNRIIVWSIVSVLLIGLLIGGIVGVNSFNPWNFKIFSFNGISAEKLDKMKTGSAEFSETQVKSLDIDWTGGEINIETENTDKIKISENSSYENDSEKAMCWYLDDSGTLEIYSSRQSLSFFTLFSWSSELKSLTVTLPESIKLDEVNINGASANVTADRLNADKLDVETASGTTEILQFVGDSVDFSSASGSITFSGTVSDSAELETVSGGCDASGEIAKLDVKSVSGEHYINVGKSNKKIKADSVSGSVHITTDCGENGFTAKYSSVSGGFSCDLPGVNKDGSFVCGNGDAEYDVSTVSGSIEIKGSN